MILQDITLVEINNGEAKQIGKDKTAYSIYNISESIDEIIEDAGEQKDEHKILKTLYETAYCYPDPVTVKDTIPEKTVTNEDGSITTYPEYQEDRTVYIAAPNPFYPITYSNYKELLKDITEAIHRCDPVT